MGWQLSSSEVVGASVELEDQGLCAQSDVDPDKWFPNEALHPRANRARAISLRRAARQCLDPTGQPCPVRLTCLRVALTRGEQNGIWAGLPGWRLREIHHTETEDQHQSSPPPQADS